MEKQRLEKQRLEKARRLQQEKAREAELKRKLEEEDAQKSTLRAESNHAPNQPTPPGEDLQRLVKLLAVGASRVLGTSPLENQQLKPVTATSHKPITATGQQLESNKPATTGEANK